MAKLALGFEFLRFSVFGFGVQDLGSMASRLRLKALYGAMQRT